MAKLRGVLFDYGHTLVWFPNFERTHLTAARNAQRILKRLGVTAEVSRIRTLVESFAHPKYGSVPNAEEEFREVFSALGVRRYGQEDLMEIVQQYWKPYVWNVRARRGAHELLTSLKNMKFKTAIVANVWSGGMNPALQRLGLERFFDTTVASVNVGFQKPDPRIFQLALDRLELAAEDVIMVGDNPKADIKPAHDIGMATVRLLRGPNRMEPDVVIPDFKINNLSALASVINASCQ
jgi:putative hydrolase of the HAD superfamily